MYFPYDYIYPEQYAYMLELKRGLDAKVLILLYFVVSFKLTKDFVHLRIAWDDETLDISLLKL